MYKNQFFKDSAHLLHMSNFYAYLLSLKQYKLYYTTNR